MTRNIAFSVLFRYICNMYARSATLAAAFFAAITACAAPQVSWLGMRHNFGAFHEDEGTVECTFRYVNTGDEPLRIVAARSSCGCTLPRYTKDDVMPGDTAMLTVSYDPTGRPGKFSKNVYIEMNVPSPRQTLTISGVVIGAPTTVAQRYPVEFGPDMRLSRGAIMAGEVARGRTKSVFLEAYNASTDTLHPAIVGSPEWADAVWMPEAIAPGEQASLVCHVLSGKCPEWGLTTDHIAINPGDGSGEILRLPVTVVVSEDFSKLTDAQRAKAPVITATPDRAAFGTIGRASGQAATETVTIRNNGRGVLEIRRVYSTDNGVSAHISHTKIKPGKTATLTISVDPGQIGGKILNSKIMIISNDPARPNLVVRAVGEISD